MSMEKPTTRILFPRSVYDQFYTCALDVLEEEISRASIRLRLRETPKTADERRQYQEELDRLSSLKYVSQLRKGKLSREDFNLKIELSN